MSNTTELYPFTDDKLEELSAYAYAHTPTFVNDPVEFVLDACQDLCGHKLSKIDREMVREVCASARTEVNFCRQELDHLTRDPSRAYIAPTVIEVFRTGDGGTDGHTLSQFAQDPYVSQAIDRAITKELITADLAKADDELLEQLHDLNQQLLNEDDNQQ